MCFTWFFVVSGKRGDLGGFRIMSRKPCVLCSFLRLLPRKLCVLRGFLTCLGNLVFYVVSGKHMFYMVS